MQLVDMEGIKCSVLGMGGCHIPESARAFHARDVPCSDVFGAALVWGGIESNGGP